MKTLSRFVAKFTSLIGAVLSCLDRARLGQEFRPIGQGVWSDPAHRLS
jgi:hypothetical protein